MPLGALDRWFLRRMRDPRDLPAVHTALAASLSVIPMALLLFVPGWMTPARLALYYVVNFVVFLDRFVLMMHTNVHRPWFKREHRLLNAYVPNVLGLFFGQTVFTYFAHHVAMHHAQDNGVDDLSSTRAYQRDRASHLAAYLLRFLLTGVPALALYFFRHGRPDIGRRVVAGELATWSLFALLATINASATVAVFIVPLVFTRMMMMMGNWAQHAFLDPEAPQTPWGSSTNIIASRHNRRCFNNGYHIIHHARPALHWSVLPQEFVDNLERYVDRRSVIFVGVPSFQLLALALVTKRYAWLERQLFRAPDDHRTPAERIAMLRSRTQPIPTAKL